MTAVLYFATAALLLAVVSRFVTRLSRGAVVVLLLLPLVFTGRAVLTGRVYAPVDLAYISQPLKDHRSELGVGEPRNPMLSDIAFQMIPWREATRRAVSNGEWPLLDPFEWCGDPLAGSMQAATWSPFTWIALLLPAALSFTFTAAIAFFVAGAGAFLLARELSCGEAASLLAAIVWMFSAPIALQILWPLGFAWTLLPFVLMATRRVIERGHAWPLLTIALALEVVAGHPETLLHVVAVAAVYGLFELVARRTIRPIVPLAIAEIAALLLTAIAILPFIDVQRQSAERHARRVFAGTPLPAGSTSSRAALLGDLLPFTRAPQSQAQRAEAGFVPLLLAIAAVFVARGRATAFFVALLVVCLLAGANVWPVAQLLHRLPLFDVALNDRLAAVVPLCIALLAAFTIDRRRSLPSWAAALILGIVLFERAIADGSLIPVFDQRAAYPPLKLFEPLAKVREPFRIAGRGATFLPNTATMYGLEDVRGSAAMTFGPLLETFGAMWGRREAGQFATVRELNAPFVAMMNVRYALLDVSDPIPAGWRDVTFDVYTRLIENERVLPRAFLPRTIRVGDSVEEMAGETDFGERSWIATGEGPHEAPNGTGGVTSARSKNGLTLAADLDHDAWIVVTEANWNGWRATVDGARIRTYAANHAFIGIHVPRGRHQVQLVYLPQAFVIGRAISIATLLALAAVAFRRAPRRVHW